MDWQGRARGRWWARATPPLHWADVPATHPLTKPNPLSPCRVVGLAGPCEAKPLADVLQHTVGIRFPSGNAGFFGVLSCRGNSREQWAIRTLEQRGCGWPPHYFIVLAKLKGRGLPPSELIWWPLLGGLSWWWLWSEDGHEGAWSFSLRLSLVKGK